ncbi:hypothetical protein SDC9_164176 [bioreactor metagenome]|uniref:Uncharacterized protein n=1 Tax=bioreactor metagenome TaxID=1076179 RepID=A0A645FTN3_9ZZZZ
MLALAAVKVVIAGITGHRALVDLQRHISQPVEQKTVVGDQQQRPGIALQEPAKPLDRRDVEIVGRFVQQEHVGPCNQHPRQRRTHPPAAGKTFDRSRQQFRTKAQSAERRLRLGFERIAAEMLEGALQFAVPRQQPPGIVARAVLGQKMLDLMELPGDVAQFGNGVGGIFGHRRIEIALLQTLFQAADPQIARQIDAAGVGTELAGDDGEESGLARAVGSDHADAVPGIDPETDVVQQRLRAVTFGNILKIDH